MALNSAQQDRALGTILASAAGDALGAPYEFKAAVLPPTPIITKAGGGWELGEWTDDTAMAMPLLRALAEGRSLDNEATLDQIVKTWVDWTYEAKDVGTQTRRVLQHLPRWNAENAEGARLTTERLHASTGRTAGNGSLMRTGPVALGYLGDHARAVRAARAISELTHYDDDAGDASVIWTVAIAHAIETGELELERGITHLPAERQQRWRDLASEAEGRMPWELTANNGWVVGAFQAAWSAITYADTLAATLELAVRCGNDTDTVAAIAGALAGAVYGASALPWSLQRHLHGWAGDGVVGDRRTLVELTTLAIGAGPDANGWPTAPTFPSKLGPTLVQHPLDEGVWLGDLAALASLPESIDGVVSLCRVGNAQAPVVRENHDEVRLIDQPGKNPHLDFVLIDAADAVATMRAEGREVLLHCLESRSRTAAVAALYAVRHLHADVEDALEALAAKMVRYEPEPFLLNAVRKLAAEAAGSVASSESVAAVRLHAGHVEDSDE
ncbi:ADP-ribosylglycohydrolase family protein [Agrococcus sp. ARC_14]|uniref:ADP-ribosylglycohydrolase family protein n=1 Tax=Agrococcus sp. ARC_14 TaxID=2919927 RepID=UPI001F064453|nr:ADP-ribosylglycohydrolase family protein [Agrococcus sp. ARC_14]MCH1883957.1 ADP-ribosylglycohydrolase family protein [Agrococcus sp. ARC_14]